MNASHSWRWLLLSAAFVVLLAATGQAQTDEPGDRGGYLGAKPRPVIEGGDPLQRLLVERFNAALRETQARFEMYRAGLIEASTTVDAVRRLLHADLELCTSAGERVEVRQKFFDYALTIERQQQARFDAGRCNVADLEAARYLRIDAEIELVRAKRQAMFE